MRLESSVGRNLGAIGPSESVRRFLEAYGKVTTRAVYTSHLKLYFAWLRDMKCVRLNPDELVLDNLKCVFESGATNTLTKRRHTDWLSKYVNGSMVERELSESKRLMRARARGSPEVRV